MDYNILTSLIGREIALYYKDKEIPVIISNMNLEFLDSEMKKILDCKAVLCDYNISSVFEYLDLNQCNYSRLPIVSKNGYFICGDKKIHCHIYNINFDIKNYISFNSAHQFGTLPSLPTDNTFKNTEISFFIDISEIEDCRKINVKYNRFDIMDI